MNYDVSMNTSAAYRTQLRCGSALKISVDCTARTRGLCLPFSLVKPYCLVLRGGRLSTPAAMSSLHINSAHLYEVNYVSVVNSCNQIPPVDGWSFKGIGNDPEVESAGVVADPFGQRGHSVERRAIQCFKSEASGVV